METVASSDYNKYEEELYQNIAYNGKMTVDIDERFP